MRGVQDVPAWGGYSTLTFQLSYSGGKKKKTTNIWPFCLSLVSLVLLQAFTQVSCFLSTLQDVNSTNLYRVMAQLLSRKQLYSG
mmetsp:Transcript_75732/g.110926  ORF Transcript_75732/g.110926 Transcript_75732/m.110926 type:complete len:84 (+) Transcript_75732:1031-1282(+)